MGPDRQTDINHSRVPFVTEYYSIIDNRYNIINNDNNDVIYLLWRLPVTFEDQSY